MTREKKAGKKQSFTQMINGFIFCIASMTFHVIGMKAQEWTKATESPFQRVRKNNSILKYKIELTNKSCPSVRKVSAECL